MTLQFEQVLGRQLAIVEKGAYVLAIHNCSGEACIF